MSVIITKFSKDDIVEMSGVMRIMNAEMNNIKSVDELIDEIKNAKMLRCKDNKGNIFVSEKDLFEFIKNAMK